MRRRGGAAGGKGSELKRLFEWLGRRSFTPALAAPIDRVMYRLFGRGLAVGIPTLILHHWGRNTGREHKCPLFYLTEGDSYVAIATNYGRQEPEWSLNLRRHPDVTIEVGRKVGPYHAELEADPVVREAYWRRFTDLLVNYAEYREKAADRDIPVWVFSPR